MTKEFLNNFLKRIVISVCILALLTACNASSQQPEISTEGIAEELPSATSPAPTETPTRTPTNTPEPTATFTPLPTDTPTPTATSTPDETATAIVVATQAAEEVLANINEDLGNYSIAMNDGHLAWFQDDPVELQVNTYLGWDAEFIDPDQEATDFVFQTDVTWESTGGLAACGFMFRAEPDIEKGGNYQFTIYRLSGLPAWLVVRFDYGRGQDLLNRSLTTSPAIDQDQGSTNKLAIIAKGNAFTFYANGKRLGTLTNSKLEKGLIAYLIRQESGETKCTFENSWLWIIDKR